MNSSKLLLSLVNDLLDLFKLRNGKFDKNETLVNFSELVHDLLDMFKFQSIEKGIVLEFKEGINGDEVIPKQLIMDV